jgi:hypothetical protein
MTKEEIKANELIERYLYDAYSICQDKKAIEFAIICVDEIIKEHEINSHIEGFRNFNVEFWQSVKQILESK